jgi:hypothetical protein
MEKNECAEYAENSNGEYGSEKATSFWFLPGIFKQTPAATFSGGIDKTSVLGYETTTI